MQAGPFLQLECISWLLSQSSNLVDLRMLFEKGLHRSEVLVVLLTPDILTRPWCRLLSVDLEAHSSAHALCLMSLNRLARNLGVIHQSDSRRARRHFCWF